MTRRAPAKLQESDIAEPVMAWLATHDWDCYPEARPYRRSPRADIAARRGSLLTIVETKTSLSTRLLEQAEHWTRYAHYVWVAVPVGCAPKETMTKVLRWLGVGVLLVNRSGQVMEWLRPALRRKVHPAARRFLASLHPDMKRYVPGGTASSGFSTPYRRTMDQVLAFIRDNPGCSLTDIMAAVHHHYRKTSTARSCIAKGLRQYEKGVRVVWTGRRMTFYVDAPEWRAAA